MLGTQSIVSATANSSPIVGRPGATVANKELARVKDVAGELEATFLSLLLKEMRQSMDEADGGLFPGDSGDVQGGLFDLYLGRHLADAGGIGMAPALVRQMQETGLAPKPLAAYGNPAAIDSARSVPPAPGS